MEPWRDDGGDVDPLGALSPFRVAIDGRDGRAGSGGKGMAGGGEGRDAAEADFRRFDVIELVLF